MRKGHVLIHAAFVCHDHDEQDTRVRVAFGLCELE